MEPTRDPKKTMCLWFWNHFVVGFFGVLGVLFQESVGSFLDICFYDFEV